MSHAADAAGANSPSAVDGNVNPTPLLPASREARVREVIRRSHDFPPGAKVALVTTFYEALEVLRSPSFIATQGMYDVMVSVAADGTVTLADGQERSAIGVEARVGPFFQVLKGKGLRQMSGAEHKRLRRALNPLVARDAHAWLGENVLAPIIESNLAAVRGAANRGLPRLDLVPFSLKLFVQIAGSLAGYDRMDDPETVERLVALHKLINDGPTRVQTMPRDARLEEFMTAIFAANKDLREHYHDPSLDRRHRLLAAHARGEVSDSDLPRDFLMMVARGTPEFADPEWAFRIGSTTIMNGVVGSSAEFLCRCFARVSAWFEEHPADWNLRTDPAFLEGAFNETLRLEGSNVAFQRMALEDVTLPSGRSVAAGEYVALLRYEIGRDPAVFGATAATWDPRRPAPRPKDAYAFGLGFGSGAHMCLGMPLVVGQGGLSGMEVPILAALFTNGARLDPNRPPAKIVDAIADQPKWASLPVVLTEPNSPTLGT
jgi:cytochrome P450